MALTKVTRHRCPLDGSWFKTTANLNSIMRAECLYDNRMDWPKFTEETRVPVYVRMEKYKAQKTRQRPDGMMYGPVIRVGTMDSPEVVMHGHHHAAGLTYDYKIDLGDPDDKWMYFPGKSFSRAHPGEDVSYYRCDKCNENLYRDDKGDRSTWSACLQDGSLVCRDCEYVGLVADGETKDQMSRCRGLANFLGAEHLAKFERNIECLSRGFSFGRPCQTRLYKEDDFSFGWVNMIFTDTGKKRGMNGGLIKHGPRPRRTATATSSRPGTTRSPSGATRPRPRSRASTGQFTPRDPRGGAAWPR